MNKMLFVTTGGENNPELYFNCLNLFAFFQSSTRLKFFSQNLLTDPLGFHTYLALNTGIVGML